MPRALSVVHVSTYAPTQCGIASYADSLAAALRRCRQSVVALDYPSRAAPPAVVPPVVARIPLRARGAYREAARQIDAGPVDVVSLQHEFGIFGGAEGAYVLDLLRALHKPVVTTLHTVSLALSPARRAQLDEVLARSARVVVLTEESAAACRTLWPHHADRLRVIEHGVPAVPWRRPADVPLRRRLDADWVFVSSGHTWRHKGYHHALLALASLMEDGVDFRYLILGAGQPQFGGADDYDASLARLARQLGLTDRIVRVARFLPTRDLLEHLAAADAGLVTYTRAEHNSSGVMPAMLACGRPVVATRFEYALAAARRWPDVHLADLADPDDIHRRLRELVADRRRLAAQQRRAHRLMQPLTWPRAAEAYRQVFAEAIDEGAPTR
jgi:glycosyltransferase involved in cell wall biosynthesis